MMQSKEIADLARRVRELEAEIRSLKLQIKYALGSTRRGDT